MFSGVSPIFLNIIILNYFMGISHISFSFRSVNGDLVSSFGGFMFPCFLHGFIFVCMSLHEIYASGVAVAAFHFVDCLL